MTRLEDDIKMTEVLLKSWCNYEIGYYNIIILHYSGTQWIVGMTVMFSL